MYVVGPVDRIHPVVEIPHPSAGATEPTVLSDDRRTALIYYVADSWPAEFGAPGAQTDAFERVATVVFTGVRGVFFGAPNDEALDNHPLYERGLGFYGAFRVEDSSWAAALERLAIKKGARPISRSPLTHYIVTMHDSTFECIAQSHTTRVERIALRDAVAAAYSSPPH
jgi:hypothetical protein